ncbi:hypothetical protein MES4922_110037 [Mesorhizobium ventifaucium]|uniref:Transposase DDE domain-containing protein n=1 Tax=Mesorhizobium ventifaucium TaxID=666020 RepID=A0ABM9DDG7_9HYPH|nr:hypothetical protein MES4922_110037 [Mesorhizobium ventifaucium]
MDGPTRYGSARVQANVVIIPSNRLKEADQCRQRRFIDTTSQAVRITHSVLRLEHAWGIIDHATWCLLACFYVQ